MTEELPLVSIVTPSYNQGQFLEETILSVLNQDYPNVEYIVVDGGSTDGSVDIIRKHEHRLACWVSEPDDGQADAINKGWRLARGEIVAWLNSDDTYVPGAVRTVVQYLQNHPQVDMIYGHMRIMDGSGKAIRTHKPPVDFDRDSLIDRGDVIAQQTVFLRKHVLDKVGMLDTSLYYSMDVDLFTRIATNFTVRGIPVVIANFRLHPDCKTYVVSLEMVMETYRVAKKHGRTGIILAGGLLASRWGEFLARDSSKATREWIERDWANIPPELSAVLQPFKGSIVSKAYRKAASIHSLAEQWPAAVACFWNGIREDPSMLLRDKILLRVPRACGYLLRSFSHRFFDGNRQSGS